MASWMRGHWERSALGQRCRLQTGQETNGLLVAVIKDAANKHHRRRVLLWLLRRPRHSSGALQRMAADSLRQSLSLRAWPTHSFKMAWLTPHWSCSRLRVVDV
jgi:hypothetical protein